jgi:antirestriction protein
MSVECGVFIVDWAEAESGLKEADAFDFFTGQEIEDEEGDFIQENCIDQEPLSDVSVTAQMEFLDCYGKIARHWQSSSKASFEKIFHTFFWGSSSEGNQVMELNAPEENVEFIDTALNPDTTGQLAEQGKQVDLAEIQALFQQHVKNSDYFPDGEDFTGYARDWLQILLKAAEQNKGVVVLVFG